MHPYIPHTKEDIKKMLDSIGVNSIDELFSDIPKDLLLDKELNIGKGLSEYEVYKKMKDLADKNNIEPVSFMGCGSYDHIIPSVVDHLISRSEFYSSYTPYQAEMSQGILQSIFEFQSMICELTSLDHSNASLYDGHTAAIEAAVMSVNSVRKSDTVLYSETIHPYTKQVLKTAFSGMNINLVEVKSENGVLSIDDLKTKIGKNIACLIVQTPNIFGIIENYSGVADLLHENKSKFVISANPMTLGVLKSQGEWGADIAIGDTQVFGLPSYFGGPSVGYMAANKKMLRKMPGRIVGQTKDKDDKRAFVLTLQAREQHIKRERATSNICSNQALAALCSTMFMSVVGKEGLKEVGKQNYSKAHYLYNKINKNLGLKLKFEKEFFNEFCIELPMKSSVIINEMMKENIFPGIALSKLLGSEFDNVLSIAVTEKRTKDEMDKFVEVLGNIIKG